jgi:hypothetical protein
MRSCLTAGIVLLSAVFLCPGAGLAVKAAASDPADTLVIAAGAEAGKPVGKSSFKVGSTGKSEYEVAKTSAGKYYLFGSVKDASGVSYKAYCPGDYGTGWIIGKGGKYYRFAKPFCPHIKGFPVGMGAFDVDHDGSSEFVIASPIEEGTGSFVDSLHVFKFVNGACTDYTLPVEDIPAWRWDDGPEPAIVTMLKAKTSVKMANDGTCTFKVGSRTYSEKLTYYESLTPTLGQVVEIGTDGKTVQMVVAVGLEGTAMVHYCCQLVSNVGFANGSFVINFVSLQGYPEEN